MASVPTTNATARFRSTLTRLRLRLTGWLLVRGLARAVPLVATLLLADGLLDWAVRFDVPQRAVLLILMAVAVAALTWWALVRPMLARLTDAGLLGEVERTTGVRRGRLRTAMEFSSRAPATDIASPVLVERLIADGLTELSGRSGARVLDRRGLAASALMLAVTTVVIAGIAVGAARAGLLTIWFDRNVMLGESLWPQKTYLEFAGVAEDGTLVVPRGEDLTLTVVTTERSVVTPATVRVEFRPSAGRPSLPMRREAGEFRLTVPPVTPPLEVRAVGGDATTDWVAVRLVEQPDVATVELAVTPPAYTGQAEPTILPAGAGPYTLLRGSRLSLIGTTNKPVTGGRLELTHPRAEGWTAWRDVTLRGGDAFAVELTDADWGRLENSLAGGRDFKLRLVFADDLGLTTRSPRAVAIRIQEDTPPRVTAETPGIVALIVPTARIPVRASALDDFGVTAMRITWRVRGETEADDLAGQVKLPIEQAEGAIGPIGIDGVYPTAVVSDYAWELAELSLPTGRRLSFFVEALDNDTLHGPGLGRSREFLVEIVTEDQLRADLLRREREMREAFEALLKGQKDLVTETRALAAAWAATTRSPEEAAASDLGQTQRTIARNVESLAVKIADVLLEIDNNKLEPPDGPLRIRLRDQVIAPMVEIAGPLAGEAVRRLDGAARRASQVAAGLDPPRAVGTSPTPPASEDRPGGGDAAAEPEDDVPVEPTAALTSAAEQMDRIVAAMEEVLFHMVKAEGYQEAVSLLMEIEKQQTGVLERTKAADRERIKRILEGGGPSAPKGPTP